MAENSQSQEPTEQPTPKKLADTKKKGDVPRSRELNTAASMFAALVGLFIFGPDIASSYQAYVIKQFSVERSVLLSDVVVVNSLTAAVINGILTIAPFLGLMFLVSLCTPIMMGGWVFSFNSLKVDVSKLNPLKGLKRTFGAQGLIELVKAILLILP